MEVKLSTTTTPDAPVVPKTEPPERVPVEPARPFVVPSEPQIEPCPRIPDGDDPFPKCSFSINLRAQIG